MLGKQAWRLLQQPTSLWATLFKGLYYPDQDFLKALPSSKPSWGWQSLLAGQDTISSKIQWSIGDGTKIKIREHCWLPTGKLRGNATVDEPERVADLIVP